MDMQVSWIDADQLKALVAQIAPKEPAAEETPSLMEIDTVPEGLMGRGDANWGFAVEWQEPPAKEVPAAAVAAAMMETVSDEPVLLEPQLAMEEEGEPEEDEPVVQVSPAALPLSRIRDKLRAIRQRATEAGILTRKNEVVPAEEVPVARVPQAEVADEGCGEKSADGDEASATEVAAASSEALPQTPAFEVPSGPREAKLGAFASWARQVLQEDGGHVLVMSDDGEVLWGGESKAGLVLSTMMAWGAAIRASAMSACATPPVIHQSLASGNVLTVIPCDTAVGMVHAAVAAPVGLSHEQARVLRGGLCAAMA
jgi:hypothetical protein